MIFAAIRLLHAIKAGHGRGLCGVMIPSKDRYHTADGGRAVWDSGAIPRCPVCEEAVARYDRELQLELELEDLAAAA